MNLIISLVFTSLQVFGFEITEVNESRGVASIKGDNIHLEEKLFVSNTNGDICKAKVIKKQNNKVLVSTKNCSFRIGKENRVSAYEGQIANNMNTRKKLRARGRRTRAKKRRGVYHGLELQLGFNRDQNKNDMSPLDYKNRMQLQVSHSFLFGHLEPFYSLGYSNISSKNNNISQPGESAYGASAGLNYNFINLLKRRKKATLVPYVSTGINYQITEQKSGDVPNVSYSPKDSVLYAFGGIGGKLFITRRTAIKLGISYHHALNISVKANSIEQNTEGESRNRIGATAALLVYL